MKKLLLTFAILSIAIGITSAHQCSEPVSPAVFKHNFNHILAMRTDQHRLSDAKSFVADNCLLSRQVAQIATLFHDDRTRLEFAKMAYLTTYDKLNFYDVYDAFAHFSNAFRLHDYVLEQRAMAIESAPPAPAQPPITHHNFPNYDYPSAASYNEEKYCDSPVSNRAFHGLVGKVIRKPNDVEKIKVASSYARYNCLSVAQVMKIGSMVNSEANRFIFLKTVFDNVYDVMNYGYADQLFTSAEYHEKFSQFLSGGSSTSSTTTALPPPPPPCSISLEAFTEIKNHIDAQTFNDTRITVAKQIIRARECFTSRQIAELVLLLAFEDGRLEIAKYAYDYCIDKNNYFLVNKSFTFDSSVKELTQYIGDRQ